MPTYDYECDACGHALEVFQGINDPRLKKCPECGKSKLKRLFGTGAAIVFKGSGFYQTDYRSDGYKKAAAADSKSDKKSSEGGSSTDTASTPKSDVKAAKKSSDGGTGGAKNNGAGGKKKSGGDS